MEPDSAEPRLQSRNTSQLLSTWVVALLCVAVACVSVLTRVHTDKVAFTPGSTANLSEKISITGAKEYPPSGSLLLATVGLTDRLTWAQWLRAKTDSDVELRNYSDVYPTGRTQELKRNQTLMDDSKLLAEVAALRYLGQDGVGHGVKVVYVQDGSPASGKLAENDVITAVGGRTICVSHDLRAGILANGTADGLTLEVTNAQGEKRTVKLKPAQSNIGPVIGVGVETVKCELPIDVKIDTAKVGGPSAGLSMTLAIIDRLTPGELTGGTVVAATGTIEADGSVGDVGGVTQKTAGVRSAGAKLFLVPPGEEQEARARAGDLPVVAVRNLDEALAALRQYGGQSLPSPRATQ